MLANLVPEWNPSEKPKPLEVDEKIRRGEAARMLLANELWKDAFKQVEHGILVKWRGSAPEEIQRRETAWLYLNALDEVSKCLHSYVTEAAVEGERLKRERDAKKRNGSLYA